MFVARFNSQRDGILLEFTAMMKNTLRGFNSQRDGILLEFKDENKDDLYGFNSQRDGILRKVGQDRQIPFLSFQFPTGWNSTRGCVRYNRYIFSFNSQRNGILSFDFYNEFSEWEFKFQTEWNSTSFGIRPLERLSRFQFPTGWNSTHRFLLLPIRGFVSIPNRMESR